MRKRRGNRRFRRGAAAVELAAVSPFIMLIFCGVVELGQYVNVAQAVSNASREGARLASRQETASVQAVQLSVQKYLHEYGAIPPQAISVVVTSMDGTSFGTSLSAIPSGEGVAVEVRVQFDSIRWTNLFNLFTSSQVSNQAVMRRE